MYFCAPQCPWRRGTNEKTNGCLIQCFPKGIDLSNYSQAELDEIARALNKRQWKTLGYWTAMSPVTCNDRLNAQP
ncbi:Fis family transcriptional regulator [Alcaligenes faecalis subsp. faecalis NCIB 8687]|nr:Fis family transcriptional regulator [Alcaligenes faecalis subsp. faecalis NCIB 8687]